MLVQEEILKDHRLTLADSFTKNADSLQDDLEKDGYLKSRYNGHDLAREKNKAKYQENLAAATQYLNKDK